MDYTEFVEWIAYDAIEPIGEGRADLRNAQLMALLANVNRDAKKRAAAYEASDFLVDWWHDAPAVNDVLAKFRGIAERINARNAEADHAND